MARQSPYPSEGARLLDQLPGSTRSKARSIGTSHTTVGRWVRGPLPPSEGERQRIERAFPSIDADAWKRKVGAAPEVVSEAAPAPAMALTFDPESELRHVAGPDPLEQLDELCTRLRQARQDESISTETLTRLSTAEVRAMNMRENLLGDLRKVIRADVAHGLMLPMFEALAQWPLVHHAVLTTLVKDIEPETVARYDECMNSFRAAHPDLVQAFDAAAAAVLEAFGEWQVRRSP